MCSLWFGKTLFYLLDIYLNIGFLRILIVIIMDHHVWSCCWCYLLLFIKLYLIHHPVNRWHAMSEILHFTQEDSLLQKSHDLLYLEEKLCKYNLHHELLLNYKKNHKFPKGMQLKFNPSLCNDEVTKKLCR